MATPLVRCLGFLSYRDEICKALSVHLGFIESVQVIFAAEGYMNLKKELIWVLSNIIGIILFCIKHAILLANQTSGFYDHLKFRDFHHKER